MTACIIPRTRIQCTLIFDWCINILRNHHCSWGTSVDFSGNPCRRIDIHKNMYIWFIFIYKIQLAKLRPFIYIHVLSYGSKLLLSFNRYSCRQMFAVLDNRNSWNQIRNIVMIAEVYNMNIIKMKNWSPALRIYHWI